MFCRGVVCVINPGVGSRPPWANILNHVTYVCMYAPLLFLLYSTLVIVVVVCVIYN